MAGDAATPPGIPVTGQDPPDLRTARLLLRPFQLRDALEVRRLAGERAVADTTLNIPHPYEIGMAEEWIGTHGPGYRAGKLANFAVTLRDGGELAGAIGLTVCSRFLRAELGYWIAIPYWGLGYCTEAGREVLRYGFQDLGLNRIFATYFSRNPASGRVMEKIGMLREGVLRGHVMKWGRYEDLVMYGILRSEWEEQSAGSCSQ